MYVIGIDPGLGGGIAFINIVESKLTAIRTPVFRPSKKNKIKRPEYDIATLVTIFDLPVSYVQSVILERVNTMPGQGIASNGKLMYGLGLMHGLIAKFPHTLVSARVWKKKFNLTADKELSRALASEKFPLCEHLWNTKNRDGLAEAALLALHGAEELHIPLETVKIQPTDRP